MELTYSLNQIDEVARTLLEHANSRVIALHGPMGAGKTTLVKSLLRELGAQDSGSSPTFGIVNEYHDTAGELLAYHFDFYRLEQESEALDLGLEEYLAQDVWVFMEWPEKVSSLLPPDCMHVRLEPFGGSQRKLTDSA